MWESAKTVAPTPNSAIIQLDIDDNFVINSTHLNMIRENKFDGYLRADPHDHIREFLAICNMFRYGETHSEAVKLLIFPFSLCDEAKTWFNELNEESITSWEQMRRSFINRFFPPSLFNRLLLKIRNFSQLVCESLIDAWLRLKNMLRKCHGHGLTKGTIIQIFYHGLDEPTQGILDITAGGIFLYKTPNQAFQFLDDKVLFEHDWPIKSKNDHHQKYVSFTDGSDSKTDNSRFMEKLKAMDSQIISLKEELQYMRKKYNELREENASKNHLNEDSPPPIIVNNKIKKDKPNKTSKKGYHVSYVSIPLLRMCTYGLCRLFWNIGSVEPVEIMDREVKSLKRSKIALVKVRWNSKRGPEFTWECEDYMKSKYPQLFVVRADESAS
ncbi:reverse transcriptase domain-containing protein [Tanacetum coccineum]